MGSVVGGDIKEPRPFSVLVRLPLMLAGWLWLSSQAYGRGICIIDGGAQCVIAELFF